MLLASLLAVQAYAFTDLGTLGNPGQESLSGGINNRGHVAGESEIPAPPGLGARHAFLWDGQQLIDIPPIIPNIGFGNDVDDLDQVVGYSSAGSVRIHAYLWDGVTHDLHTNFPLDFSRANGINAFGLVAGVYSDFVPGSMISQFRAFLLYGAGAWQDLGTLGGLEAQARALDDVGRVVGFSRDASGRHRGFLWTPAAGMVDLGDLGGNYCDAEDISNRRVVVGAAEDVQGRFRPFRWSGGTMTDLGTLGGPEGRAKGVNERGQIVGSAQDAAGVQHAVLWHNGAIVDLDAFAPAGGQWRLSGAHDINELGEICGTGRFNGVRRAYKLTPVSPFAPLLAGPTPAIPGGEVKVFGLGFAPGAVVQLGGSGQTALTPVPGCMAVHELRTPVLLGTTVADAAGRAEWSLYAPHGLSGHTVHVQALETSAPAVCQVSELSTVNFL